MHSFSVVVSQFFRPFWPAWFINLWLHVLFVFDVSQITFKHLHLTLRWVTHCGNFFFLSLFRALHSTSSEEQRCFQKWWVNAKGNNVRLFLCPYKSEHWHNNLHSDKNKFKLQLVTLHYLHPLWHWLVSHFRLIIWNLEFCLPTKLIQATSTNLQGRIVDLK